MLQILLVSHGIIGGGTFVQRRSDLGVDIWCNKVQALAVTGFEDDMRGPTANLSGDANFG
jgi:hypothetical protein